jgi:elongator complex protein 6
MPPSSRIPPLLQPYVDLPSDESILLLTSTLGASANWLTIRFLCGALSNAPDGVQDEGHNVVLVSWMREYEFWRQEARKSAGLDLERLKKEGRFTFVDGLSGLALDAVSAQAGGSQDALPKAQPRAGASANATGLPDQRAAQTLPSRGPPGRVVPARGPPATPPTRAAAPPISTAPASTTSNPATPGHHTLSTPELAHVQSTLSSAVSALSSTPQRKTLIVLDNPDAPLALYPHISPASLTSLFLALHSLPGVSHVLVHLQSDTPLLSPSVPPQPLELAQHNLLVKTAHMSRRILGVRVLDTGVARDVSGVVRVTEQRVGWMGLGLELETAGASGDDKGKEFLYQVKGDGGVKVFERGAGGEG